MLNMYCYFGFLNERIFQFIKLQFSLDRVYSSCEDLVRVRISWSQKENSSKN